MDPFLGEIKMVGFNFVPTGYAFCNGALMSISQNSALFALLGTTFGGDGVQTFGLPDFRGRSPVGMGNGPGLTAIVQGELSGTESTTILPTQMPMHTHTASTSVAIPVNTAAATSITPSAAMVLATTADSTRSAEISIYGAGPADATLLPFSPAITVGMAGGNQPLPIRNPFNGTNFIIALQGVFPSRQ